MKKIILYLLIIIPLLVSCQEKYNAPPYNQYEADLRKLPLETERIIIPKEWEKMDSLSFLRFKEINHIIIDADSIPPWIINFKKTKNIYSHFGKIKYLPLNFGKMHNIEKIAIFSHNLKEIPYSICDLENLEYLSLSSNNIKTIPDCLFQMKNLKYIELISNEIDYLPLSISSEKLEEISLAGNQIKELPESIYTLSNLKEISLGGNPLKNPEEIKKRFEEKGVKVLLK
uniref:leucine-rich repeat domain-containing protein n=1 Tax=Ornithobacterium rhinotracheale TaxID=28251 RepID=UPI0039A776CF